MRTSEVFIGLGSNLGDGPRNLLDGWRRLGELAGVQLRRLSNPYRTEPLGMVSAQAFTNAVGELATALAPEELLRAMLAIEADLGRDRQVGKDRPLDLDILFYGDLVIAEKALAVPHPELAGRAFVLAPLAELAPEHRHPVLGRTAQELFEVCPGRQGVERDVWPLPEEKR